MSFLQFLAEIFASGGVEAVSYGLPHLLVGTPIGLRNTLSGELETFEPLGKTVKMYNCGPTVYDRQHIGNLRGAVLANTLKRTLEAKGLRVDHVSNITDVGHLSGDNFGDADTGEDRMEVAAKKMGKHSQQIAEEITSLYFADLDALGIDRSAMRFPKATEYIQEQIALVEQLFEKGFAYNISDGVYFDTSKFPNYGELGGVKTAAMQAGARVEENTEKKDPHDFALWKFSKPGEKRDQEWDSPWGVGFPGWHIECTAMIFKLLGEQIDIHIGGEDLAPIHHNNEIAQAEAATGKKFVQHWLHNAFITIDGKKVSKSLGNTVYLSEFAERGLDPRALRYLYLTAHYRTPMNFTWEAAEAADTALKRLRRETAAAQPQRDADKDGSSEDEQRQFLEAFYAALADDLDTPKALALVWEHLKSLNRATLDQVDKVLGLGLAEEAAPVEIPEGIQQLLDARQAARKHKDFEKADQMRQEIESAGYELKDTPEGPQIFKK
jgi:cysteinyl-tRNA synthetase